MLSSNDRRFPGHTASDIFRIVFHISRAHLITFVIRQLQTTLTLIVICSKTARNIEILVLNFHTSELSSSLLSNSQVCKIFNECLTYDGEEKREWGISERVNK